MRKPTAMVALSCAIALGCADELPTEARAPAEAASVSVASAYRTMAPPAATVAIIALDDFATRVLPELGDTRDAARLRGVTEQLRQVLDTGDAAGAESYAAQLRKLIAELRGLDRDGVLAADLDVLELSLTLTDDAVRTGTRDAH